MNLVYIKKCHYSSKYSVGIVLCNKIEDSSGKRTVHEQIRGSERRFMLEFTYMVASLHKSMRRFNLLEYAKMLILYQLTLRNSFYKRFTTVNLIFLECLTTVLMETGHIRALNIHALP